MKYLSVLLTLGLTLSIVAVVAVFSVLPQEDAVQSPEEDAVEAVEPPVVGPVTMDTTSVEEEWARRETVYRDQVAQLDQAIQERQSIYQAQIENLNAQIAAAQTQRDELAAQEQALTTQIAELETARADRLATYQTRLAQARRQYDARYAEIQTQLNDVKAKLKEIAP